MSEREQRLVFGEVAGAYDAARPSYPEAMFDAVMEYGALAPGDAALEIGAGTGKGTAGFVARGLQVHALEPSPEMAALLTRTGAHVEVTTFEDWPLRAGAYKLAYAAQAWHWVESEDRFEKPHSDHRMIPDDVRAQLHTEVAAAIDRPGGTLACTYDCHLYLAHKM